VTGAAGSIGSAVCRTVARLKPSKLILIELNEHGLYEISREIGAYATFPTVSLLGSVADGHFIERALKAHQVDTIFHCAAYKHVPLVEENAVEGVRNNIFGTQVLAEAAWRLGVPNLVLISSDKAVRPANVMGATKRWSELIVRHYGAKPGAGVTSRNFCSVRFGNVIGSSGSVVPLFKEQIANGGPVTVTHDDMTRYFMSVREAAELILQASALSESGDILLLEMGEPVRIRSLAEDMIVLAGLSVRDANNPSGDIEVKAVGLRAGEKLHEELFYDPAGVAATGHPKILRAKRRSGSSDHVPAVLDEISAAIAARDEAEVRRILFEFVQRGYGEPAKPRRAKVA
jgi:FlaA1/EpsC-like NDP-sugar epimerase